MIGVNSDTGYRRRFGSIYTALAGVRFTHYELQDTDLETLAQDIEKNPEYAAQRLRELVTRLAPPAKEV